MRAAESEMALPFFCLIFCFNVSIVPGWCKMTNMSEKRLQEKTESDILYNRVNYHSPKSSGFYVSQL